MTSLSSVRDFIDEFSDGTDEQLMLLEGHDNALVGVVQRFNATFALYDLAKVLENLIAGGMTHDEATEWYEFNMLGAWVGGSTPAFLIRP